MPPKPATASIEEFDDDFEFELPSAPAAASSGAPGGPDQMAALQQMMAQMGGGAGGGPSAGMPPPGFGDGGSSRAATGDDPNAEHKQWTTIYPIYIDAKRPYGKGCRRVKYESSCLFANSLYIAKALATLKVELVHEPNKTHPKDWENPGRVKAKLFDDEWKSIHPQFRTKKALLEAVSKLVQPMSGGAPPPLPDLKALSQKIYDRRVKARAATNAAGKPANAPAGDKKGAAATNKKATPAAGDTKTAVGRKQDKIKRPALDPIKTRLQPVRFPPLDRRLPPHSPAVEQGVLNFDLAGAMGGVGGAGNPMASMLGGMMGGGDDDEDEEEAKDAKKDEKAGPNLSRRQRKRVVRVGR